MSVMFSKTSRVTIRKAMVLSLACIGLAFGIAVRANAAPVVLTFEGVGNQAYVEQFYNGGTDSQGHSGTNYGIEFGGAAFADSRPGIDPPAPSFATILFFLGTEGATMNVVGGFDIFSFFYAPSGIAGSVVVYDGLNATGNVLATLPLSFPDPCEVILCAWIPIGVSLGGTAHSVSFAGAANFFAFDNITLDSAMSVDPTPVPEPGALGMMMSGLALLAILHRRRRLS